MYAESAWGCWDVPAEGVQEGGSTLYATLELNIMATEAEIRQQFRRLALRWHPDKCRGSTERFQAIREAFEVLSNPQSKEQYDKTLGVVNQLDIEEYLRRFSELVLTVQGFNLPLHRAALHRPAHPQQPQAQQQRPQHRPRRFAAQHVHAHAAAHPQGSAPLWGGLLTRA